MARHALLSDSRVVNVIEIGPEARYEPPEGCTVLYSPACLWAGIGDTWSGSEFEPANPLAGGGSTESEQDKADRLALDGALEDPAVPEWARAMIRSLRR